MASVTEAKGYGGKARFTVFASAARALAQDYTSDDFTVPYGKTLTLIVNVTTGAATPAVTPKIQGVTAGSVVYSILTGAQITSTSAATVVMRVGAGVADVSNLGSSIPLPQVFRVVMTHGDTDSLTYSVEAEVA